MLGVSVQHAVYPSRDGARVYIPNYHHQLCRAVASNQKSTARNVELPLLFPPLCSPLLPFLSEFSTVSQLKLRRTYAVERFVTGKIASARENDLLQGRV